MKKVLTMAVTIVLMAVTFIAGAVWAQNHTRRTLTIETCVRQDDRVEELESEIFDLKNERRARLTLGNSQTDEAYSRAVRDGVVEYDLYVDGRNAVFVHAPVSDTRNEWAVVGGIVDDVTELRNHYGSDCEVEVRFR